MAQYFLISGYFIDDKTEFEGYLVKDTHDMIESEDDDIFFYGLSETDIKEAILSQEPISEDFVITSYEPTT